MAEYEKAVGSPLPATITGDYATGRGGRPIVTQAQIETDPQADANVYTPRQKALALYNETLDRLHL